MLLTLLLIFESLCGHKRPSTKVIASSLLFFHSSGWNVIVLARVAYKAS